MQGTKNNKEQLQTGSVQTKQSTCTFAKNCFNPDKLQTRCFQNRQSPASGSKSNSLHYLDENK
jgi:hypothetical protein